MPANKNGRFVLLLLAGILIMIYLGTGQSTVIADDTHLQAVCIHNSYPVYLRHQSSYKIIPDKPFSFIVLTLTSNV